MPRTHDLRTPHCHFLPQGGRACAAMHFLRCLDAPEIDRELTHRLHGPRPRDLLTASRRFGVARILAVDDSHRVGSDGHFAASGQVLWNCDAIRNASVAAGVSRPEPTSPL